MMKTCASILFGFLLAGVSAPGLAAEDAAPQGKVRIRIANVTDIPFTEVNVRFPSQQEAYGPLAPGATSEYRDVERAYSYASITIMAEGQRYGALAADYFNETALEPGSYTYTLDLYGGAPRFGLLVDEQANKPFPARWSGVWNGAQRVGTGYVNVVLEFTANNGGILAFEFGSSNNTYVYAFAQDHAEPRDGYYEIALTKLLEGNAQNMAFKLLLLRESLPGKITAVLLMRDQDSSFFAPTTVDLVKPDDEQPSFTLYEKILPHKTAAP